jgi:hypothetical protein
MSGHLVQSYGASGETPDSGGQFIVLSRPMD